MSTDHNPDPPPGVRGSSEATFGESSSPYIPNSQDTRLPQRVESCVRPHLSYSCRFWATHVQATDFDTELANETRSFFDDERLLFWIEALGFLKALSGAVAALPVIAQWLKGHTGYKDVSTAMDVQRFIQVFGGSILHSTPHLYVSALPFSPVNSTMATKFTAMFPNSLRLTSGHDVNWAAVQTVMGGHTSSVLSVSFSPDGNRIASGSWDKTVRLWDAATGQPLGEPLRGHTSEVSSVSFLPDATRIASGSHDKTLQLWHTVAGPLQECPAPNSILPLDRSRIMQRFIQVSAGIIVRSTPHLYVPGLPSSPVNSTMATKFMAAAFAVSRP